MKPCLFGNSLSVNYFRTETYRSSLECYSLSELREQRSERSLCNATDGRSNLMKFSDTKKPSSRSSMVIRYSNLSSSLFRSFHQGEQRTAANFEIMKILKIQLKKSANNLVLSPTAEHRSAGKQVENSRRR